jgi:pimeloyl-ACP methyl ester carboxylesterase
VLITVLATAPEVVDRAVVSSVLLKPLPLADPLSLISRAMLPVARNRAFQKLQARSFHIRDADFETYYDDVRQFTSDTLGRLPAENSSFRLPPGPYTTVPTLVLAGEKELGAVRASAGELAAALPNARGRLIRGADHAFLFAHPGRFAGILRAWFTDQPLPEDILIPLPKISLKTWSTGGSSIMADSKNDQSFTLDPDTNVMLYNG